MQIAVSTLWSVQFPDVACPIVDTSRSYDTIYPRQNLLIVHLRERERAPSDSAMSRVVTECKAPSVSSPLPSCDVTRNATTPRLRSERLRTLPGRSSARGQVAGLSFGCSWLRDSACKIRERSPSTLETYAMLRDAAHRERTIQCLFRARFLA